MDIEIAQRLVSRRKEAGLSQEALAEKLGVSRQAVSKWERSESSPDTDNLITLARLYNVSLDQLLFSDEDASAVTLPGEGQGIAHSTPGGEESSPTPSSVSEEDGENQEKSHDPAAAAKDTKDTKTVKDAKDKHDAGFIIWRRRLLKFPYFLLALVVSMGLLMLNFLEELVLLLMASIFVYYGLLFVVGFFSKDLQQKIAKTLDRWKARLWTDPRGYVVEGERFDSVEQAREKLGDEVGDTLPVSEKRFTEQGERLFRFPYVLIALGLFFVVLSLSQSDILSLLMVSVPVYYGVAFVLGRRTPKG